MVVGTAVQDAHGPVELLHEDEAHHLMGEGHAREGDFLLRRFVHPPGKTVRAAHHEDQPFADGVHLPLHILCKFHGAHFPSAFVQQDNRVARLERTQDEVGLLLLLHVGGEVLGVLQLGDDLEVERQVTARALHVVVDGGGGWSS